MADIRWAQRFENFQKAHMHFEELTAKSELNWIEQTALIKVFEILFELSWKTMKDYLDSEGVVCKSPRETIKQAYQMGLIQNGEQWLDALEKRNILTHRYDENFAKEITTIICSQYPALFSQLKAELNRILQAENQP